MREVAQSGRCESNRPLNVLHLTTFYPPYSFGGDAMYIYRLSHALADAGHQVDVIHDIDSYHLLHPGLPEVKFTGHPNVKVHGLKSGRRLVLQSYLRALCTLAKGALVV